VDKRIFSDGALRALAESAMLGALLCAVLMRLNGQVSPDVINTGLFVITALYSAWAVWRWRIPEGSPVVQMLREAGMALAVGLLLGLLETVVACLIGLPAVLEQNAISIDAGSLAGIFVFMGLSVYSFLRLGRRLWRFWDSLRKRRLVWSITHAQLMTAVGLALAVGCVLQLLILQPDYPGDFAPREVNGPWPVVLAAWLISSIIPTLSVMIVFTCAGLAVILPLASVVSYLVARRTTRRVEALARAARDMRQGRLQTRVPPEGRDEVSQLQSDFNSMADTLEKTLRDLQAERDRVADLLESRQAMTASVSHELRTPLAALRGYLETARQYPQMPDGLKHDLDVMEQETGRLQSLVEDLFTLSRVDSGGLSVQCAPVDAAALVQRMADALSPLAWQSRRVQIGVECDENIPPGWADAGRLEQVVANLVRNAVRHTGAGGIVSLKVAAEDPHILLAVRDTGEGIAPEDLPHIWERYFRGRNAIDHDGAGLGLALVKELVEAMGGSVEVENLAAGGCQFTVRLRRAP
jgi:signal transduction histidine kinase